MDEPASGTHYSLRHCRSAASARWRVKTTHLRGGAAARIPHAAAHRPKTTFRRNRPGAAWQSFWLDRLRISCCASDFVGRRAGVRVVAGKAKQPVVGEVVLGSPAAIAGIRSGDRIVAINNVAIGNGKVSSIPFIRPSAGSWTSSTSATAFGPRSTLHRVRARQRLGKIRMHRLLAGARIRTRRSIRRRTGERSLSFSPYRQSNV